MSRTENEAAMDADNVTKAIDSFSVKPINFVGPRSSCTLADGILCKIPVSLS